MSSAVVQVEGGIGKHIALTAIVEEVSKNYDSVFTFSAYPEIYEGIATRSMGFDQPFGYDYYKEADAIFFPCGYRESDFRKQKIHLIEAACKSIHLPYDKEMKPVLKFTKKEMDTVIQIKKDIGSFVVCQFHGGKSPQAHNQNPNIMAKDYPPDKAEKLVELIKAEGRQVINMALPDEPRIKGSLDMTLNAKLWFALLLVSDTFASIDSSLQHAGAAVNKPGVVLWGATNPKTFGYDLHTNLERECPLNDLHCQRPYFVPSADLNGRHEPWECPSKECMNFDPEDVAKEVKEFFDDTKYPPMVDVGKFTSQFTGVKKE